MGGKSSKQQSQPEKRATPLPPHVPLAHLDSGITVHSFPRASDEPGDRYFVHMAPATAEQRQRAFPPCLSIEFWYDFVLGFRHVLNPTRLDVFLLSAGDHGAAMVVTRQGESSRYHPDTVYFVKTQPKVPERSTESVVEENARVEALKRELQGRPE